MIYILKIQYFQLPKINKNKNKRKLKLLLYFSSAAQQKIMTSISLLSINDNSSSHNSQRPVTLPRFHKQFIGIGHQLQQKKKQRKKIEDQQRAIANRVIFLQKEEIRAQRTLKKKKSELSKVLETIQRNNIQKEQKQHLRHLREIQLEALRDQNKNQRLIHKEVSQTSRFILQSEKHHTYSRIKSFKKQKQQQKQDFLYEDMRNKKDRWMSLNIDKQKGKQKIDKFYKIKNKQHTLNYLHQIQKQEETRMQKLNTIKHLEMFQTALRKKLQESSMKVSLVQDKIMQTSRTVQVRKPASQQHINDILLPSAKPLSSKNADISPSTITASNPQQHNQLNISFQKSQGLNQKQLGSQTDRKQASQQQMENQIEEKIEQPSNEEMELSGFKIIRTLKRGKKNTTRRYREYL